MKYNEHNFDSDPSLPFDQNGKKSFGLPSDYFSSFEDKLKKRLEAENELSEFPVLAAINKVNTFLVPDDYFSASQHKLEQAVELSSYTSLNSIKKYAFIDLEEDYAIYLKGALAHKIELAEELKPYETLYNLEKERAFMVPENYFENLQIKDRIHTVKESRVSVVDRVLDFIFGRKVALAFGALVVIAFSVFIYGLSKENVEKSNCQTLACLEKQEILNDRSINTFDEDQLMDLVDINSLSKQLRNEMLETDSLQPEEYILDNVDTDQLLEEL